MVQESMDLMVKMSLQLTSVILIVSVFQRQINLYANVGLWDKPTNASLSVPCCLEQEKNRLY